MERESHTSGTIAGLLFIMDVSIVDLFGLTVGIQVVRGNAAIAKDPDKAVARAALDQDAAVALHNHAERKRLDFHPDATTSMHLEEQQVRIDELVGVNFREAVDLNQVEFIDRDIDVDRAAVITINDQGSVLYPGTDLGYRTLIALYFDGTRFALRKNDVGIGVHHQSIEVRRFRIGSMEFSRFTEYGIAGTHQEKSSEE